MSGSLNVSEKLTDEAFEKFSERVNLMCEILGLKSWEINVMRQSQFTEDSAVNEEANDWRAMTICSTEDKFAMIVIAEEWDVDFDEYWLTRVAFHESLEILCWEMFEKLKDKERGRMVHTVIRTLENSFFLYLWESLNDQED